MKGSEDRHERMRSKARRARKIEKIVRSEALVPWWMWVLLAAGLFVALCPGVIEILF